MARDDFAYPPRHTATPSEDDAPPQRYGCRIGGWPLLIPSADLGHVNSASVRRARTIHALPHSAPSFPGLVEHCDRLLPVFDPRPLCNPSPPVAPVGMPWLLVLDWGCEAFALMIDELPTALHDLQPVPVPEPLPEILRSCLHSALAAAERQWLEFDPTALCRQLLRIGTSPTLLRTRQP